MTTAKSRAAVVAYKDEQFIESDDGRPLRILAEYLEPLHAFAHERVCDTIVFFGSARLTEHGPLGHYYQAARELAKDQQKLAALQQQRAGLSGPSAAKIDEKIADLKGEMLGLQVVKAGKVDGSIQLADNFLGGFGDNIKDATKNPELLFYKLKTNAYKFSWALIPISVPFVWLLFPFSRRFRLYDHTVFVTYSLCFMMLLLALSSVIGLVSEAASSLAWFVPPIHMYRQLRGAYGLSRGSATWRSALLTLFAFMAISLFASLLVTMGAFE